MKKHTVWIALSLVLIFGLAGYLILKQKKSSALTGYVPQNAAFIISFNTNFLSDEETETLSRFGIPPKMLKQLLGNPQKPGPLLHCKMVLFGEQTPAGPALGLLFAPEDVSVFSNIVSETRYTGSPIDEKNDIRFLELNTGLYLAWDDEIALLSYQLTSGDAYTMSIIHPNKEKSEFAENVNYDSVQCMIKPVSLMQMLNHEKPSQVLIGIAGIIPEKTTLCGTLHLQNGSLTMPMDVTAGANELEAFLKSSAGGEMCSDEPRGNAGGSLIQLALQKPLVGSIAELTGQAGNPLLSKLNGNACLWLPEKKKDTEEQPWQLWLGSEFSENEKIMLKQLPKGASVTSMSGLQIEPSGNCLLLSPAGQAPQVSVYQQPKYPLEIHLCNPERMISLTGNSRKMQLHLQSLSAKGSVLILLLDALGNLTPNENKL